MDNLQIEFGNKIRSLREATGLSQEKFALKIGMDRTYYHDQCSKRIHYILNIYKLP